MSRIVERIPIAVLTALLISTCSMDAATTTAADEMIRPSSEGPYVSADSVEIVDSARWVDPTGRTPALDRPLPDTGPHAVFVDDQPDGALRIAVNGNGCTPTVLLSAKGGPPVVEITVEIGEAVPEPGLECSDILTTHAFDLRLASDQEDYKVDLDAKLLSSSP